jgi:hypothetical protein
MPATPSLLNVILGAIAASIFVVRLLATYIFMPPTEPATTVSYRWEKSGHSHKADRMPLFRAAGRSVTTTTPIKLRGGAGSDNTTVVAKNVVIHPTQAAWPLDDSALAQEARPVGVVVIKPADRRADHQNRDRPGHHVARRGLALTSE